VMSWLRHLDQLRLGFDRSEARARQTADRP
jgi:hypothetical protein